MLRYKGKRGRISNGSPKPKTSKAPLEKELCALLLLLRSSFCLHPPRIQKKTSILQKEKRTTNRREPGGRGGDERSIKGFMVLVFWKKTLCGLCALCGSILFFLPGGYEDSDTLPGNKKSPFLVDKKGLDVSVHPTLSSKVSLPCWS